MEGQTNGRRPHSARDMRLIEQARRTPCFRWHEINGLMERAESGRTRERLESIRNLKYHLEEAGTGCL